jgi:hypothetical protein
LQARINNDAMKKNRWISLVLIVLLTGCSSTSKITSSWKAPDMQARQYNKILVLALINEKDRTMQENMEKHMAGDLQHLGYNALSSLQEYGPKAFDKMDENTAIDKLKNTGVDAVITIVLLDKRKERKYVPGSVYYSPYGFYYSRFWGYRSALYNRIYEPGYYVVDTKDFWESNLYDMPTQKLVYSVQTQSFDPGSSESLGHGYGQLIVKDMVKNHILTDNHTPVTNHK